MNYICLHKDFSNSEELFSICVDLSVSGIKGKGITGEVQDTILYVDRLWKSSEKVFNFKPTKADLFGGETNPHL